MKEPSYIHFAKHLFPKIQILTMEYNVKYKECSEATIWVAKKLNRFPINKKDIFIMAPRIVFIPGNGGGSPQDNWFPEVKKELQKANLDVVASEFPDNNLARASYWLPFLLNDLKVDENTILVGHSSGAIAAMRLAEKISLWGSVLVGAYYTDLGMGKEKQSGYFDKPWNWNRIRNNQKWIILFASQNDPWIPVTEPRHIHAQLDCEYHEYKDLGHFGGDYYKTTFPELSHAILRNLKMR